MAYLGNQQAHASVGSPFSTSAVTAGVVDILYPFEVTLPSEIIPGSAPIASASGVTSQASKNSSAKKFKKMSPNKSPAKKIKKNTPKKTAKKSKKK
jgi:hypothetical protein